jgi:S-adenosylmethionine:tRNA ribosyltransferase-isomerase
MTVPRPPAEAGEAEPFLDYPIPPGQVASHPSPRRGDSRLLVADRARGRLTHARFRDLPGHLRAGDLLVLNDTRVVPARLLARKKGTGGRVEVLVTSWDGPAWEGIVKGSLRPGHRLELPGRPEEAEVLAVEGNLARLTPFRREDPLGFFREAGRLPLPPYLARRPEEEETPRDRRRYQTVFARTPGSVAAPTAGLHFTPSLLARCRAAGAGVARVTLHVGWGTFAPLGGDWRRHQIHREWGELSPEAADLVNGTLARGGRVIPVGTTSLRLLEGRFDAATGRVIAGRGWIDLYVTPGFTFRATSALVTNFHRPASSLLLLVNALAGPALTRSAYLEAAAAGYRFFSYGDAMLIL